MVVSAARAGVAEVSAAGAGATLSVADVSAGISLAAWEVSWADGWAPVLSVAGAAAVESIEGAVDEELSVAAAGNCTAGVPVVSAVAVVSVTAVVSAAAVVSTGEVATFGLGFGGGAGLAGGAVSRWMSMIPRLSGKRLPWLNLKLKLRLS